MTQPETITMTEQKEAAAFAKQHEAEELLSMQIDDFEGEEIDPDNEPDLYLPLSAAKALHEALSTQAAALATARAEAEDKDAEIARLREAGNVLRDKLLGFVGAMALYTDCGPDVDAIKVWESI